MANDKEKKNEIALTVSIIAVLFTLFGLIGTGFSLFYTEKQTELNSTVATFQVQAQTTADYQYAQQLNIQKTQIAMQSQMDAWSRLQTQPLIQVVIPPEHVYTVNSVTTEQVSSGYLIHGTGTLDLVLANNGGGKAGLLNIDWVDETGRNKNLMVDSIKLGNVLVSMPSTIEAQTPVMIQLELEATVPYSEDPKGKSDYLLGEYWKKVLLANANTSSISITFSNASPVVINISDIQLRMPEMGFQPDPPSPFEVTNKTELGIVCYSTGGKEINTRVVNSENKETGVIINDGACFSYPSGDYKIFMSGEYVLFSVDSGQRLPVDLAGDYSLVGFVKKISEAWLIGVAGLSAIAASLVWVMKDFAWKRKLLQVWAVENERDEILYSAVIRLNMGDTHLVNLVSKYGSTLFELRRRSRGYDLIFNEHGSLALNLRGRNGLEENHIHTIGNMDGVIYYIFFGDRTILNKLKKN